MGLDITKVKYRKHKATAKRRGLRPLTFFEYVLKLKDAGIIAEQIGKLKHEYQLCRYTDDGDYTFSSCRFATRLENEKDMIKNGCHKKGSAWKIGASKYDNHVLAAVSKANQKPFNAISPSGKLVIGVNLFQFCKDNKLSQGGMWNLLHGKQSQHKGWRAASARLLSFINPA